MLVFCASLAAPLLGVGGSAEAQEVLVSNISSASSTAVRLGDASDSKDAVQVFTTGTNTGGYTLTSIALRFTRATGTGFVPTVTLHNVTVSSTSVTLGNAVATLTTSATSVDSNVVRLTYTAPTDTSLNASTTYGVFVHGGGTAVEWDLATSGDEDATPAAGWSIGDQAAIRAHDATGALTLGSDGPGQIQVNGTAKAGANNPPTVATVIPDQSATAGTAFSYAFPDTTFSDADSDALTYTATKADGTALPTWLSFTASTRTFSGTPQAADITTVSVKVTASDGNGGSVSDEFDITVSAAADTTPPTLTSATVLGSGVSIEFRFSESVRRLIACRTSSPTSSARQSQGSYILRRRSM